MPGGHPHAKKRNDVLGKAIIKAAIKSRTQKRKASAGGTGFHVADLENSRNPLQSVTEISSMEEFMAAASMAERDFTAERATVRIVSDEALPNAAQRAKGTTGAMSGSFGPLTLRETPSGSVKSLRIPRRPKWDGKTSAEDLQRMEKDAFLAWRRALATEELKHGAGVLGAASSNDEAHVTPFEKNIEVWRQLWRVVERADVLVQIVDARNPLLYRCGDLEEYVRDVNPLKSVLLLVNKADFLTPTQRLAWARYFASQGVPFIFFSAKREQERLEELDRMQRGLSTRRDLISDVFVAEAVRTASKGALLRERIAKATESRDMYGSHGEEDEENEDEIENEEEEEEDVEDVTVGPDNSISIASALTRRRIGAFTDYNVNEDEDEENDEEEEEEAKNKYSEEIEDNDEVEEVNISTSILDLNDNEPQTDVKRVNSTTEGDQSEQRRRREERGGGGNIKQTDQSLSQTVPLPIPVNSANTCEVENDPLSAACHVYTRDELIDFLTENFKSTSLGSSNAASRKRREELRTRQREEARAARKDELKRRREMHQRMVEIGLGAHVRFGGEGDALALGEDEEDEEGAAMFEDEEDEEDQPLQVGMVGYPNVGKSSTINALLGVTSVSHGMQRVAVASTPGKTKHFQTLSLNSEITLVDCPGLVFPSFIQTREEMVVNGILPIDQLREHVSPMRLVCQRIPRKTLISTYGVKLPVPMSALTTPNVQVRQPTVSELLDAFCIMRGFMASTHAGADHPRAARTILKDYCEGKLVYCHPPPSGWISTSSSSSTSISIPSSSHISSSLSTYSRVTLEDNVLLPTASSSHLNRNGANTVGGILPTISPMRVSLTTKSDHLEPPKFLSSTSLSLNKQLDSDINRSSTGIETGPVVLAKKLPVLTEADLLAFSRVVPVSSQTKGGGGSSTGDNKNKRLDDYELYEYESEDDDEEEDDEEDNHIGSSAAADRAYVSSAAADPSPPSIHYPSHSKTNVRGSINSQTIDSSTVSSIVSKKVRQPHVSGLGRFGQKKKGSREPDPYGTERIADAAMRKNVQEEIRLVQQGPAGVGVVLSGDADNTRVDHGQSLASSALPRAAKALGPSAASPPSAPQTKQVRVIRAGAVVQDPVPASLRGQNIAPTLVGISSSVLLRSTKIKIATTE